MRSTQANEQEAILHALQQVWPEVTFTCQDLLGDQRFQRITWTDGPSFPEVQDALRHLRHLLARQILPRREISDLAWITLRGPDLPPGSEELLTCDQLRREIFTHDHLHKTTQNLERRYEDTNLEDLSALPGGKRALIQAEIALGLAELDPSSTRTMLDLWLARGGWSLAGRLLDTEV